MRMGIYHLAEESMKRALYAFLIWRVCNNLQSIASRIYNEQAEICVLTTEYCEILERYQIKMKKRAHFFLGI